MAHSFDISIVIYIKIIHRSTLITDPSLVKKSSITVQVLEVQMAGSRTSVFELVLELEVQMASSRTSVLELKN